MHSLRVLRMGSKHKDIITLPLLIDVVSLHVYNQYKAPADKRMLVTLNY